MLTSDARLIDAAAEALGITRNAWMLQQLAKAKYRKKPPVRRAVPLRCTAADAFELTECAIEARRNRTAYVRDVCVQAAREQLKGKNSG